MQFHEIANLFPLLNGGEFDEMVEDIRANGLLEPIVTLDGQILDGRNRYRACEAADVTPEFVEFNGNDPVAFVRSQNLHRRHLTPSQRAACAADADALIEREREKARERQAQAAGEARGTKKAASVPQSVAEEKGESAEKVAESFGSNRESLRQARKLRESNEQLFGQVKTGALTLPEAGRRAQVAETVAALPEDEHERADAITQRLTREGTSTSIVAKLAKNLTAMPQEERLRVYTLAETDDTQSWSRVQTDLAGTPPMPHPALAHLDPALDQIAKALRHLTDTHAATVRRSRDDIRHVASILSNEADNEQAV